MHLIYLDESGNSGQNLGDPAQPVFTLCAMVVEENRWQALEASLKLALDKHLLKWSDDPDFEVHAIDLRRGSGPFKGMSVAERIAFRNEWMGCAESHGIRLITRSVIKKQYSTWLAKTFGSGVTINPHVAAFALVARCINHYLHDLPGHPLGMLISDENKEIVADVEKSIRTLRVIEGGLKLSQIIEKGFFIDSKKSLPLQLCDLFTFSLRKRTERMQKIAEAKTIDDSGIAIAEKLLYSNTKDEVDVIEWLTKQHQVAEKKEAARG